MDNGANTMHKFSDTMTEAEESTMTNVHDYKAALNAAMLALRAMTDDLSESGGQMSAWTARLVQELTEKHGDTVIETAQSLNVPPRHRPAHSPSYADWPEEHPDWANRRNLL